MNWNSVRWLILWTIAYFELAIFFHKKLVECLPNVQKALGSIPSTHKLGLVVHPCVPTTWGAEARESTVKGHPSQAGAYLVYTRHCHTKMKNINIKQTIVIKTVLLRKCLLRNLFHRYQVSHFVCFFFFFWSHDKKVVSVFTVLSEFWHWHLRFGHHKLNLSSCVCLQSWLIWCTFCLLPHISGMWTFEWDPVAFSPNCQVYLSFPLCFASPVIALTKSYPSHRCVIWVLVNFCWSSGLASQPPWVSNQATGWQ